eukprot:GSChrysophyteH1.ASY1.ANO1.2074.1 assembled CDS
MSSSWKRIHFGGAANTCGSATLVWIPSREEDLGKSLVIYPLHNTVAVVAVEPGRSGRSQLLVTLCGHPGMVNAISWVNIPNVGTEIHSCGQDGSVRVWQRKLGASMEDWECSQVLQVPEPTAAPSGLASPLTTVTSVFAQNCAYLSACDSAGSVFTWRQVLSGPKSNHGYEIMNTLRFSSAQLPHSLHLLSYDGGAKGDDDKASGDTANIVLLIGCVDARLHVAVGLTSGNLQLVGTLPGHQEWVTCICSRMSPAFLSSTASERNQSAATMSMFVATGSKDQKIRIWRFSKEVRAGLTSDITDDKKIGFGAQQMIEDEDGDADADGEDLEDAGQGSAQAIHPQVDEDDLVGSHEARLSFALETSDTVCVFLETLLVGHEDWVSSVQWLPASCDDSVTGAVHLVSVSMDRNIIIWKSNTLNGAAYGSASLWTPLCRFGDVGGMLGGSIGGNLLGFTSACISPSGNALLAIGYGGSFHLYHNEPPEESLSTASKANVSRWTASSFLTGHHDSVTDIVWSDYRAGDVNDGFLVSVSSDQTCRVYARVTSSSSSSSNNDDGAIWCEVSRPQIHGYNLTAAVIIPCTQRQGAQFGTFKLYSAGDEKMIRVYQAPTNVLEGLQQLCNICGPNNTSTLSTQAVAPVVSAYIPELSLSSRATDLMSKSERDEISSRGTGQSIDWKLGPPLEGQLADLTVWPEIDKLFGLTNDIVCMDICKSPCVGMGANNGAAKVALPYRYIAAACKARNATTAAIALWDTESMTQVCALDGHDSTVSCMRFSPDGNFLASSGKDRSLCLYENTTDAEQTNGVNVNTPHVHAPFTLYALQKGAHKRIVWDLGWVDERNWESNTSKDTLLATVSRDGVAKIWRVKFGLSAEERGQALLCLQCVTPFGGIAITSIAIRTDSIAHIAFGGENGKIQLWKLENKEGQIDLVEVSQVPKNYSHGAAVRKLAWNPNSPGMLASCSDDTTVRIFDVNTQ